MKKRKLFGGVGLVLLGSGVIIASMPSALVAPSALAIQYRDGSTGFSYPLRLTRARTTRNIVGERRPTYYISFTFPAAAEEALDKVVISLDEGRRDPTFNYRLEATQAVANTPQGDRALPIGNVIQDPDTKALTIQFDPPVAPGDSITLALKPDHNPRFEGVYLFGVNAFPLGPQAEPTFVGYARLSFYQPSGGDMWP